MARELAFRWHLFLNDQKNDLKLKILIFFLNDELTAAVRSFQKSGGIFFLSVDSHSTWGVAIMELQACSRLMEGVVTSHLVPYRGCSFLECFSVILGHKEKHLMGNSLPNCVTQGN